MLNHTKSEWFLIFPTPCTIQVVFFYILSVTKGRLYVHCVILAFVFDKMDRF